MDHAPSHAQLELLLSAWDFLVEIRSFRLDLSKGQPWAAAFKQALDDWCYALDEGGGLFAKRWQRDERGTLVDRDKFELDELGTYRFFEPSEIALPADLPPLACPLLGAPCGYVAIKLDWGADRDAARELVTALIKESMGRVLATEREWKLGRDAAAPPQPMPLIDMPCTAKKSFSLLLEKYSIEDGDVLLSRKDDAYLRYVIGEVKSALGREGYAGEVGALSTCHNPFRYWEEDGRFYIFGPNGSRPSQRELEAFLDRHEFAIWVFDFDGVDRLADSVEVSVMWA